MCTPARADNTLRTTMVWSSGTTDAHPSEHSEGLDWDCRALEWDSAPWDLMTLTEASVSSFFIRNESLNHSNFARTDVDNNGFGKIAFDTLIR